ncbi:bifunctional adenosylcobinamide kinase/adenosylcobinamide-phosphate guanylyltransferase [Cohnella sp. CBP 2801]|uniref:Bifunctional adenosylcobinamide kinase/adenosylcobinamide-phosphate guanylyltransferase n=2 Tax=Cohnella zeiphila TaxID=2761120 RepID=A0A7X0VWN8_9BACL|nr:bifunctional adenosylcobinamide kinase/adenosylcobinamide-phosphate guanylyltransferase [Cohnella zeiphila]
MLWIVTGGIGCGKSAFAMRFAVAHGREAIRLVCPSWPSDGEPGELLKALEKSAQPCGGDDVAWTSFPADRSLADRLNRINLQTNPFRANLKVVLLDSLSGWLRREVADVRSEESEPGGAAEREKNGADGRRDKPEESAREFRERTERLEASLDRLVRGLLDFQGRRVVVTEQASAGLAADPWERWFVRALAEANRRLADRCDGMHLLVSGMALDWKGLRTKRGNADHENIYPKR